MVTKKRRQSQAVFRAIADPTRREILRILRPGERSVGAIAGNFRMSRPAVSKHLRLLKAAGLVKSRRRGTENICEIDARPLEAVNDWVREYAALWDESLRRLKKHVEEQP